jgi:hypothetical protein
LVRIKSKSVPGKSTKQQKSNKTTKKVTKQQKKLK